MEFRARETFFASELRFGCESAHTKHEITVDISSWLTISRSRNVSKGISNYSNEAVR